MDNALKAIDRTDDTLTVGNYIILYGGRDLEGEYFTANTALESRFTKAGRLPVDWEHGAEKAGPGDAVLGYVDWSTAKADDRGVWVQRTLDRHNDYVKWIETLIDEGVVGTSSEAIGERVEKATDGQIIVWPLRADALTVTPMEPRMITENVIQAYKALGLQIPTEPEPAGTEPEADPSAASVAGARADIILFQAKLAGG